MTIGSDVSQATTVAPVQHDELPAPVRGVERPSVRNMRLQKGGVLFITLVPLAGVVGAIIAMWGWGVTWLDLGLMFGMYVITGLGITVGYHRLLTHKSFDAPPWLRATWAAMGSMAVQGSPIDWVATHRRHHAFSDQYGDPHSPHVDGAGGLPGLLRGLWHSHVGWLWRPSGTLAQVWAPDLLEEPKLVAVNRRFVHLIVASFAFSPVLAFIVTGGSFKAALTALLWGSLVRVFLLHHVTWAINSVCHVFGTKPYDSHDESRNNAVMGILAFGEGWHNAHHAFPASARHGLRWWEFDTSWLVIRAMSWVGLARNIKLPSTNQIQRRMVKRRVA